MSHLSDSRLEEHVLAIEAINDEIADLVEARRLRYQMLKDEGYSAPTTRAVIARRKQDPAARVERDMLLDIYERALNGEQVAIPDQRQDQRELAIAILAEQIQGIGDPAQARALAEHVAVILDIRAEIALLKEQEKGRKALAKAEGFDAPALTRVVRWIEKCLKHGADVMRAGEAVFHLYRGSLDAQGPTASLLEGPARPVKFDPVAEKAARPSAAASKNAARNAAWLNTGLGG
jgi:uncharacterized protein (UPF0335 family)